MKKKTSKAIVMGLILMLTVSAMAFLTSCGDPATLEDYINDNKEAKKELESINSASQQDGVSTKVEIKENTITYSFTYSKTYGKDEKKQMSAYFENYMETVGSTFQTIAKKFEEEAKIDGIVVRVTYLNGDGTEIYTQDFKNEK